MGLFVLTSSDVSVFLFLTSARSADSFSPSCFSPFTQIPVISADHLTSHKYVTQM